MNKLNVIKAHELKWLKLVLQSERQDIPNFVDHNIACNIQNIKTHKNR